MATTHKIVCPHDCPDTCVATVEVVGTSFAFARLSLYSLEAVLAIVMPAAADRCPPGVIPA